MDIEIRKYLPEDYSDVKSLYQESGWFDELIDSMEILNKQVNEAPGSILVAISEGKIIGTLTMLATGRLALFFRLACPEMEAWRMLLEEGEKYFVDKGYNRLDIVAPEEDTLRQIGYEDVGYNKGNLFRWYWKEKV